MNRPVILNADSNPATRSAVTGILAGEGIHVREAGGGAECVGLAAANGPDVVVIAPALDDMSGAELSRQLGRMCGAKRLLRVPTPLPNDFGAGWADCGADAYTAEPVQASMLACAVRSLFRLHDAERQSEWRRRQLEQAQDETQLLMYRTSHDLSEPLRAMAALAEMIARGGTGRLTPAEAGMLEQVTEGVDRSRRLLHYLVSYSQVLREPRSLFRNFNLSAALLAAQSQLRRQLEDCGGEVETGSLPEVFGNPARLQQLIAALLSNALKYRAEGAPPRVAIQASRELRGPWLITVRDNGIGIPPQYHESIFQPFQRLHGREVPGAGMGLALARRIVEAHGGRLWVESTPGHGAAFHFTLPHEEAGGA